MFPCALDCGRECDGCGDCLPPLPRCPVCGEEAAVIYRRREGGEIVGCDQCLEAIYS